MKPSQPSTNGRLHPPKRSRAETAKLRWAMFNAFVDYGARESKLSPATRVVWLDLFRHASPDIVTRSIVQIVETTGLSKRQVRRSLASLKAATLIRVLVQGRFGKGASKYRIRSRIPPEKPPPNPSTPGISVPGK